MMGFVDNAMARVVAQWKEDRQWLREQLEWWMSGKFEAREMSDTGWVDTTADVVEGDKRKIAERVF
jgi:hypothetical protein